jgi:endonuclease-3 related protein
VAALRARRLLDPRRLMAAPEAQLAGVLEHGGPTTHRRAFGATDPQTPTHRLKARRLRAFTRWLLRRYDGHFDGLRRAPLGPLRAELLRVPGLGPETVDTILLYAAHRPVFVADAYTRRVLVRHRLIRRTAGYEATRAFLEAHLPSDPALFGELHALFVASGKSD